MKEKLKFGARVISSLLTSVKLTEKTTFYKDGKEVTYEETMLNPIAITGAITATAFLLSKVFSCKK